MLFEQYHSQDLLAPTINDGGVNKLNSSLTSLDFYLLDDINAYLPPIQSEKSKKDLINDSIYDNSQYQAEEDFFSDFNFPEFDHCAEKSDILPIDDLEIEKWLSEASFPSPPMDGINSPFSNMEDTSSWFGEEYPINTDMTVPLSPPSSSASSSSSSTSSSPAPSIKKTKLSTVERKLRKKDQNKNAAEKYRIKKKSERHQLLDRHLIAKNINKDLKLELENLTYRVQQLKQLVADFILPN